MNKLISIIIPIYNVEEYLADCLESVKRNLDGLSTAEVLLIDDGSIDNSSVIAKLYAEKDKRFHYHYKRNGGPSSARNYGVSLAVGKYLFFMDSDDMLVEGILKKMLETAERKQTELTVCNVARMKDKKVSESYLHVRAFNGLKDNITHITKHPNFVYDSTSGNKLILRSFYLKNNVVFPEGYLYEDMPVYLKIHNSCNAVSVIKETGYLYRIRTTANTQITKKYNLRTLQDKIKMMAQSLDYARENSLNSAIMEAMEVKFLTMDFDVWLERLYLLSQDEAWEQVNLIADFTRNYIDKEYISRIPLIKQQIFYDLLQGYIAHLLQVINYKNANGPRVPIVASETGLKMVLPSHLFTIKNRNAECQFCNNSLPVSLVSSVAVREKTVSLQGYLYLKRISIPFDGSQYFKAILLNEYSGKTLPLSVTAVRTSHLTESQGRILNYDDYQYCQYDYDGAGFSIEIDFEELLQNHDFTGKNYIFISYDFKYVTGEWTLKGVSGNAKKMAEKFIYENEHYKGKLVFDAQNIIYILLGDKEDIVWQNSKKNDVPVTPFSSTVAGRQLMKLQKENKSLLKYKTELERIKKSNGYKVLKQYYKIRNFLK